MRIALYIGLILLMFSCKEPVGNTTVPVTIPAETPPHKDFILKYHGDFDNGKKLFRQNCRVCHSEDDTQYFGPGMEGLFNRIQLTEDSLKLYILNDDTEHPIQFSGTLSDQDLNDIIYFLYNNTIVGG